MTGVFDRIGAGGFTFTGFGVAAVGTGASLWLSRVVGLSPCPLCWYQRVALFPLVVVLGVALIERRVTAYRTALPLSVGGGSIAAYHSYLQATTVSCGLGDCARVVWRDPIVGLSIPNLSLVAFALVTLAMVGAWWTR